MGMVSQTFLGPGEIVLMVYQLMARQFWFSKVVQWSLCVNVTRGLAWDLEETVLGAENTLGNFQSEFFMHITLSNSDLQLRVNTGTVPSHMYDFY